MLLWKSDAWVQCSQLFPFLSVDFGLPTSRTQVATLASFLAQRAWRKLIQGEAVFRYFSIFDPKKIFPSVAVGVGDCIVCFMILYDFCLFFSFSFFFFCLWIFFYSSGKCFGFVFRFDFFKTGLSENGIIFVIVIRRWSVLNRKKKIFSFFD